MKTTSFLGRKFLAAFRRAALFSFSALLLISCVTRLSEANKLFEAGLFAESAAAYEKILDTDPENSDAKIGLAKSRSELWKKELVSIRLMRMSGNGKGALERLEELLEKTAVWDLSRFQSGDLVSAEEEVRNGRRVLDALVREQLNDKKPVVASHYWNKFNQVREAKKYGSYSSAIYNDIQKEGQELCVRLQELISNTSFSFNNVYKAVCAFYGADAKTIALDNQQEYRFSRIDLANGLSVRSYEATSDSQAKIILGLFDERLKKIGMFSAQSPYTLSAQLQGEFVRIYDAQPTLMAHSYREKVPFQAIEEYEDTEYVNRTVNGVARTDERKVKKTRPVTRYRMEPRTHRYQAIKHSERLRLNMSLSAKALQEFSIGYAQDKDNNFVTHEENLPHIGLTPLQSKFMVVSDWLQENYTKMSDQFIEKLALTTADKFCQAVKLNEVSKDSAENFSRCAELNPKNSAATAWFASTFGLERAEVLRVVGKVVH